jgi:hypothetical protein
LESAPLPARWSITNRIFNLVPRSIYDSPPRPPASRLWNPVNSSPRNLAVHQQQQQQPPTSARTRTRDEPNVPVQRPLSSFRDEYPLLTLPERRLSRQSPAPSSLFVERSTGGDSSRASIGLPRDRRSEHFELPQPPQPAMVVGQDHAPADARDGPVPARAEDPELGAVVRKPSTSRVSIPSRPNSMHSQGASRMGDEQGDGDDASEFPWGPSHPCFPHPNSHVPLHSEVYDNTRIIRVKRDWMVKGDLAPTFANLYPEILDPALSEEDFRKVVQKINDTLVSAFNPFSFRAWLDSVLGVATFWLWDDAGLTKVKKQLAGLERWIENWNKKHGAEEGVKIIPLRRTGYLTVRLFHLVAVLKLTYAVGHPNTRPAPWTRQRHFTTQHPRRRTCQCGTSARRLHGLCDDANVPGQFSRGPRKSVITPPRPSSFLASTCTTRGFPYLS